MNRAGFTLIEVMIAAVVMAGAVLGLAALIPTITLQTETAHESNLAMAAVNQVTEAIRQYADDDWLYVWRAYNADPSDDPNADHSGAPGNTFTVTGLTAQDGGILVGTVTFYLDETVTDARRGLPRDLDGDGAETNTDVSAVYTLLPFTVSVDWKGRNGMARHVEVSSQMVDY